MTPEEITRTAAQHARYCATFIAEHVPALAGDRPPLDAITAELPNLYAAWQWAADHQQSDLHEQMKPGLEAYYDLRNALAASIPATPSGAQDGPESTTGQCTSTVAAGVAADSASYWTSHPCMRRAHTRAKAVEPPLSTAVAVGADGAGGVAA